MCGGKTLEELEAIRLCYDIVFGEEDVSARSVPEPQIHAAREAKITPGSYQTSFRKSFHDARDLSTCSAPVVYYDDFTILQGLSNHGRECPAHDLRAVVTQKHH